MNDPTKRKELEALFLDFQRFFPLIGKSGLDIVDCLQNNYCNNIIKYQKNVIVPSPDIRDNPLMFNMLH